MKRRGERVAHAAARRTQRVVFEAQEWIVDVVAEVSAELAEASGAEDPAEGPDDDYDEEDGLPPLREASPVGRAARGAVKASVAQALRLIRALAPAPRLGGASDAPTSVE